MPYPAFITRERREALMRALLEMLVEMGGKAKAGELLKAVATRMDVTPVERELNTKGNPRWQAQIRFNSIGFSKAGWLHKNDGFWEITPEGRQALRLPNDQFYREVSRKYREWLQAKHATTAGSAVERDDDDELPESHVHVVNFEEAKENARTAIEERLFTLTPYEFQDLVGHLLRAMGYFTAPPGPDGGVDLIVYKDPLGTVAPRIKVQVKHRRDNKVNSREIRELQGLIQHEEVGLMVSSGGFALDAANEARRASKHIDLIDLDRFITLWQEHYLKLSEEGRAMLPLVAIYHLAPTED